MEGPIHSLLLEGNLKTNSGIIFLKLPHSNFGHGLWQLRLKSLGFKAREVTNNCVILKSNFISDMRISTTNELEPYNSTLLLTYIKGNLNEMKVFHYDDECWFTVNNFFETLEITFIDSFDKTNIVKNIDVILHILIKRIK